MRVIFSLLTIIIFFNAASAQLSKEFDDKCHVYIVDVAKAAKAETEKDLAVAETTFPEFITKIGEEELTTKNYRFPKSKLFITASVFYTDESMASHSQKYKVNDQSMLIGIMVSSKAEESALSAETPNASVTEVTYDEYTNIVRIKQYINVGGRKYLLGLQCDCLASEKTRK